MVPAVDDALAWATPAEPDEVEDVAAFLITLVEPSLEHNPGRVRALTGIVAMQGYTRAELLLGLRRLPVRNAYGQGFRPDLLDEVVQESRRARRIVADPIDGRPRLLTERQMFDACAEHPEYFRPESFGVFTYDVTDRPLYRYAAEPTPRRTATPSLAEAAPPRRLAAGTGAPVSLSALVEAELAKKPSGDGAAGEAPDAP